MLYLRSSLILAAGMVAAVSSVGAAKAQTPDPLLSTSAYSLSIRPDGWDRERYVPLGVLFPRDRDELISYGFDFTEQDVAPLVDPDGDGLTMEWFAARGGKTGPDPEPGGLGLFEASWPWHMMPMNVNVSGYGKFTKSRSYFDPAVRRFMLDADAALARTYGAAGRPAMMWSLDNEWEGGLDYSPAALKGFDAWLKTAYGNLPALNAAWGEDYRDWSDVVAPKSEAVVSRPAAWLDWHAYQDDYLTRFFAARYRAIYEADPRHRGIAQKSTQQSYDLQTVGKDRSLDPALLSDLTRPYGGWYGTDIYDADDSYIYQVNFAAQCIRSPDDAGSGHLFLTETNNHGGPGRQFANSVWRTLGNGAKAYDLFCFGMPGATDDSDIYGLTAPNTLLRGKAPYAARFAYSVRRTEDFWARSVPAPGARRVAILLNRRDMLVTDNIPGNMWAGPANSREGVFAALRQAGYWVDVIPYTKLNARYLKQYGALLLVGGDHLTAGECAQIAGYVKGGGVLVADMLAGYYDEHHRVTRGLEPVLGTYITSFQTGDKARVTLQSAAGVLNGRDIARIDPGSTQVVAQADGQTPLVLENSYGKGTAVYLATRLGELHGKTEDLFRDWLKDLLTDARVAPAYGIVDDEEATAQLRLEQPFAANGNLALIVANASERGSSACVVRVQLPPGEWRHALWAPAESEALQPVAVKRLQDGRHEIALPVVETAGMLLLFNNHDPLISLSEIETQKHGIDDALPALTPGAPAHVAVSVYNPSPVKTPPGILTVRALRGWTVEPGIVHTPPIAPYGVYWTSVSVTPPKTGVLPYTERMYPINARWSDGKRDRAVTTTPVGVDIDNRLCPWLLTDNATYPADFPRKIKTGATYTYLPGAQPLKSLVSDPADGNAAPGRALLSGYSRWLMDSESVSLKSSASGTPTIEFDLKAVYPLHEVRLLSSEFGGYPARLDVSVSADGRNFTPAGSAVPEGKPGSGKWLVVGGLDGRAARYVRLNVSLQGGQGRVNEVEIWGYPKPDRPQ